MLGIAGRRPKYWWDLGQDINSALGGLLGTHVRASSATFIHPVTGLVTTVGNNIPRFESVGGHRAILLEPAGTNLCTDSEVFRAAISMAWTQVRSSITDDAVIAPDGNTTSDKFVEDGSAATTHYMTATVPRADITDDTDVTFSVYAKEGERNWIYIAIRTKGGGQRTAYFNLADGTIHTVAGCTARIETEPIAGYWNGHYKCSITADIQNGVLDPLFSIYIAEADTDITFNGDGTSGLYVWGAQVEEFPVPTSYIPTSGATATRATESGYPLWTLPAGLFDGMGMCSVWWRPGFASTDGNAGRNIVAVHDADTSSLVYIYSAGGLGQIRSHDETTVALNALNWVANTWYKLVVKWGYDVGGNEKFRVGVDSGTGIVWGAEINFDGSYSLGANFRLALSLWGPMWMRDLRLYFDEILDDTVLNEIVGSP